MSLLVAVRVGGCSARTGLSLAGLVVSWSLVAPVAAARPPGSASTVPPTTAAKPTGEINHFDWFLHNESKRLHGVQLGGINEADELRGLQLALLNASRDAKGVQIGLASVAKSLSGVQLSVSCFQIAIEMKGLQLGTGVQYAKQLRGVQLGAFAFGSDTRGAQVSAVNVTDEAHGLQLGVANYVSGEMRGVQIGVVNISHGSPLSLGLVNWAVDGRTEVLARSSSSGFLGGEVRNGSSLHHNFYLVDFNPWRKDTRLGIGLGLHFGIGLGAIDVDASLFQVLRRAREDSSAKLHDLGSELDARLVIEFGRHLGLLVGPGVEYRYGNDDTESLQHGLGWNGPVRRSSMRHSLWPVASLGFRLTLDRGHKPNVKPPPRAAPPR